jgi:hypothetical protein
MAIALALFALDCSGSLTQSCLKVNKWLCTFPQPLDYEDSLG